MVKKRFPQIMIIVSLLLAVSLPAGAARAQNLNQACTIDRNSPLCKETQATAGGAGIWSVLGSVANLISIVAGIAGVIMIMIGGFRYIRSSGDPSATAEAQKTILYALIGLMVAATGRILALFVVNRLPG